MGKITNLISEYIKKSKEEQAHKEIIASVKEMCGKLKEKKSR